MGVPASQTRPNLGPMPSAEGARALVLLGSVAHRAAVVPAVHADHVELQGV